MGLGQPEERLSASSRQGRGCTPEVSIQSIRRLDRVAHASTLSVYWAQPNTKHEYRAVETGGEEFLIAGANAAGGVVIFRSGRDLVELVRNEDIAKRTSFVFV